MQYIKIILLILSIVVAVIFALSNRDFVSISLYPFPFKVYTPLFIIVIFTFGFGVVFSTFLRFVAGLEERRGIKLYQQKIKALENEIDGMKTDMKIKASI